MNGCNCNQFVGTNANQIPFFLANSPQVRETSVDFGLGFRNISPAGYMTVNITTPIPEGTDATLPVRFVLNNQTRELVYFGGTAVTAGDIAGTGVLMLFHNAFTGLLQLVSVLPTAAAATQGNATQGNGN